MKPKGIVRVAGLTTWLWIFAVAPAGASSPHLGLVMPRGAQRGTEVTLHLQGARLADAQDILFYSTGFQVKTLRVVNQAVLEAQVRISGDCRLGEHALRVRTATGISELRTFYVGALPNIDEKEPNNDFRAPQKIPLNVTVNGVITNEDVDYFSIEAKKGQRITAEIEGMRLGGVFFDPRVAILDSKRFELAASDDCRLLGQDAVASVIIPADGTYVIEVRESAYGGSTSSYYRLHVGTFPRPLGTLPAGGRPGEELRARFLDPLGGQREEKVKLPAEIPGTFGLFAHDAAGIAPSWNPFRITTHPNVLEVEPNDRPQQATPCRLPAALNGIISHPGDVDCFRFHAETGKVYDFDCYARRLGSPLDPVLSISALGGPVLAANDDFHGPDSYLRFTVPKTGEYTVAIRDQLGKGGPTYFYRIEAGPPEPKIDLTIPKAIFFSQERQTIPVPRGNRYAALVYAHRVDCAGELLLGAEGLPAGVRMHAEPVPASVDTVPVLFEAAADAPLSGRLATLTARLTNSKQHIPSEFRQVAELIVGPPNQSVYWKYETDRVASAVTEAAPFDVELIEPQVPLVQGGTMNLHALVKCRPGFDKPITVSLAWNPPGVSSGSVTVPVGQTQAFLPVNASPVAQVLKWKVTATATADMGGGLLWVASPFVGLEVASPFIALTLDRAAAEQGQATELGCKVQHLRPFDGTARARLVGLPVGASTLAVDLGQETNEISFPIRVGPSCPVGRHRGIFCELIIMQHGEPIVHHLGSTELRVDVPLAAAARQAKAPLPPASGGKRLSRLEQLRLEQRQREGVKSKASER